jgi:hypothetical protein
VVNILLFSNLVVYVPDGMILNFEGHIGALFSLKKLSRRCRQLPENFYYCPHRLEN